MRKTRSGESVSADLRYFGRWHGQTDAAELVSSISTSASEKDSASWGRRVTRGAPADPRKDRKATNGNGKEAHGSAAELSRDGSKFLSSSREKLPFRQAEPEEITLNDNNDVVRHTRKAILSLWPRDTAFPAALAHMPEGMISREAAEPVLLEPVDPEEIMRLWRSSSRRDKRDLTSLSGIPGAAGPGFPGDGVRAGAEKPRASGGKWERGRVPEAPPRRDKDDPWDDVDTSTKNADESFDFGSMADESAKLRDEFERMAQREQRQTQIEAEQQARRAQLAAAKDIGSPVKAEAPHSQPPGGASVFDDDLARARKAQAARSPVLPASPFGSSLLASAELSIGT
eukprot:scaffold148_cov243-Pinguiococcus_pyrenoidosus.AAC.11